ncbi:MAG: acyl-CoA dehydrogenase family protein [Deltaproteobacteria bacterium]|nr:acyl-CoA dehydrogenase family protein [Deltaproteobacteria bacterium]MCL5276166.1 acyl-CoA dehydrogenase family protein [Deltaproteobacteria bacterium]
MSKEAVSKPVGGGFLLGDGPAATIFVPEQFTEEQLSFSETAVDFMEKDVLPLTEKMEEHDKKIEINVKLMKKAGEIGLLMIEIPEEFGGLGMDLSTSLKVSEAIARSGSFAATILAHSGIGTLPIVYFGNEAQKRKYLPKLATGEMIAAYGLTETGYGSDALGAKTKAVLSPDKKYYVLNGEKQFITNSGFADLFIIYAKVDGEKFTAFIVERKFEGLSTAKEENKMGIKGSSTRSVILNDVKVPVENVLGEIGKGHQSALGVLDIGRLKLGMASVGGSKEIIKYAVQYANQRMQFGQPISSFGMIRRKFADMMTKVYVTESMSYRTSGMIDDAIHALDRKAPDFSKKAAKIFEDYDIEASIMKVYGSEMLGFVVDEAVQSYGGYGYIEDYPVARAYRDARINRIFEGTNEINRLLIPATILKRSMKGELDFMGRLDDILAEIKADRVNKTPGQGLLGTEMLAADIAKKITVYAAGVSVQKYMSSLTDKAFNFGRGEYIFEQLANMMMETYAIDSAILRTLKLKELKGEPAISIPVLMTRAFVYETLNKIALIARQVLGDVAQDNADEFTTYEKALARLTFTYALDLSGIKERIAAHVVEKEGYTL